MAAILSSFRRVQIYSWVLGLGVGFAAWGAEHPEVSHESATEKKSGAVNPALQAAEARLSSPNLKDGPAGGISAAAREKLFKTRLQYARELRLRKSYAQARQSLAGIVQGTAPLELRQTALIELALLAQEEGQLARAQQIYSQFIQRYPNHPDGPELLLRQGLLYRQMGAPTLALSKFYGVMNISLQVQEGELEQYRRLVLQAQTEIAETYYVQGDFEDAAEFFSRLLKLNEPDLNVPMVEHKLLRCLAALGRHRETVFRAGEFLEKFPDFPDLPEVRFLMAVSLQAQGRSSEALEQLSELLAGQRQLAETDVTRWRYWQQRVGNEVANQLYQHGDYLHAVELYKTLAELDPAPTWQIPVWYQIALSYERLDQPSKAIATYQRITTRQADLKDTLPPSLTSVVEMARWRVDFLQWQIKASRNLSLPNPAPPAPQASPHDPPPSSG